MASPAIEIDNLSKKYTKTNYYALNKLRLRVDSGEVYGFLGPNGAGKSTTIRLLLNFIMPTGGTAKILGQDIVKDSVNLKESIGYLSGDVSLYGKMTGRQLLDFMSELTPVKHKDYLKELINTYQAQLDKPINELSKGNRQKIGLIQAFMHEPEVLILDEPTSGLDPLMQSIFFDYVKSAKSSGSSIFLSSHDLTEVQKICDRIGFIRDGKLIAEQTIADLAETASHTFDISFADEVPVNEFKKYPSISIETQKDKNISVHIRGDLSPLFLILSQHKVLLFDNREISLEQEFMHLYKVKNI